MKKYIFSFLLGLLLVVAPFVAQATPTSWDFTGSILRPLQSMWNSEVQVPFITATSTSATSTLPRLQVTTLYLLGKFFDVTQNGGTKGMVLQTTGTSTAWVATSTLGLATTTLTNNWVLRNGDALAPSTTLGIIVNASSTIGGGASTTGLTISGNSTTTGAAFFNGNVGIGTSTVGSKKLALNGTQRFSHPTLPVDISNNAGGFLIESPNAATNNAAFRLLPAGDDIFFQNNYSSGNIRFTGVNNTDLLGSILFRTSANVGINLTSPSALASFTIKATGTRDYINLVGSTSAEQVTFTQDGRLGMGIAAPTELIHALGNGIFQNGSRNTLQFGADVNATTLTNVVRHVGGVVTPPFTIAQVPVGVLQGDNDSTNNNVYFGGAPGSSAVQAATNMQFLTSSALNTTGGTVRMAILGNGNVGIASSTPNYKLTASGTVAFVGLTASAGTPNSVCINATTKEITENPALTCTVSSRDYKNSINNLNLDDYAVVLKMNPVSFMYNDTKRERYGFIAEELASNDKRLADGWDGDGNPRSIDQNAILAVTVKAVKHLISDIHLLFDWNTKQDASIEQLQKENSNLEQRLEKLEQ